MGDRYLNYKGNLFLIKNEILEDVKINNKNVAEHYNTLSHKIINY